MTQNLKELKQLIKLANHLDAKGLYKEADVIDLFLKESIEKNSNFFGQLKNKMYGLLQIEENEQEKEERERRERFEREIWAPPASKKNYNYYLTLDSGGKKYPIPSSGEIFVGRREENPPPYPFIPIENAPLTISRKHFSIEIVDGKPVITRMENANPVMVGDQRIMPGEKLTVKNFPAEIKLSHDQMSLIINFTTNKSFV